MVEPVIWRDHPITAVIQLLFKLGGRIPDFGPDDSLRYLFWRIARLWKYPYLLHHKWNESGFRPPLCTYRLNWARRTSWGWWDDWDDTVLQTQDSKFEPWRSEAEHATSRSRRLPTILTFTRGWGRNIFVSFKPPRPGTEPRTLAWKAAVLTTTLGPPPFCIIDPVPPSTTSDQHWTSIGSMYPVCWDSGYTWVFLARSCFWTRSAGHDGTLFFTCVRISAGHLSSPRDEC